MSETTSFGELQPGDAILLPEMTRLPQVLPRIEDIIAETLDPRMTEKEKESWAQRVPLHPVLRYPGYNGNTANIGLIIMGNALGRLRTARQRGWTFDSEHGPPRAAADDGVAGNLRGFLYVADMVGLTGKRKGQIQAELWFSKVPTNANKYATTGPDGERIIRVTERKRVEKHSGRSVRRFITEPITVSAKFIELADAPRQVDYSELTL